MEGQVNEFTLDQLIESDKIEKADQYFAILMGDSNGDCYIRPDKSQVFTAECQIEDLNVRNLNEEETNQYCLDYAKAIEEYFINFNKNIGCGKCVPCREGAKRILEIVQKYINQSLKPHDIDTLFQLVETLTDTPMCGIGKNAAKPAGNMAMLISEKTKHVLVNITKLSGPDEEEGGFIIVEDKCKGCSKCARNCPVSAITGVVRSPFTIDAGLCIKCGVCMNSCPFNAIKEM